LSKMNSSVVQYPVKTDTSITKSTRELMNLIGIQYDRLGINIASLPFAPVDATAGSESEMQTIVLGKRTDVDLPLVIEQSNYLANIRKRAKSGDTSAKIMTDLEQYLNSNNENIWENSWVRFPMKKLGKYSREVLLHDLSADKDNPAKGKRADIDRFLYQQNGDDFIRMPVSYLLKLSLAEIIGASDLTDSLIVKTGLKVMDNFLNDNTSPETSSFYIISTPSANSIGKNVAKEMAIRYLLGQILIMYANKQFALQENGQEALMFFSPHPPVRQKVLSNCISDSFYRELFMNPCLSGWNDGEEKYEYMHLCHRVLSRSQFNAVLKLREAGIITSNLVSLPNLSNISLANNGTHVSIGSLKLSSLLSDSSSGYTRHHEKYLGDLVVKIVEHFLPLFVGTYTAAPYRLAFTDFHPEKAQYARQKRRAAQQVQKEKHGQVFVHAGHQFVAPDKTAPERLLARAITPNQQLFQSKRGDDGQYARRDIHQRQHKQPFAQAYVILHNIGRVDNRRGQHNKYRGRQYHAEKFYQQPQRD